MNCKIKGKFLIDKINKIKELLPNVLTPASPISDPRFLQGRKDLLNDIERAILRRGSSILLYGERGVGKTSVAKIATQSIEGNNFYYSSSSNDTFESISCAILSH
jgi:Cdc6-like AAA superfamily ATPase